MDDHLLLPRTVRMPEFAPGDWLNTNHPLTRETLRGQPLLIDFWDYTCVNCLRTFPYLNAWHPRYHDLGLNMIGIHAPEFKFARSRAQIEAAIKAHNLRYPVLLDNEYANWEQFAVRAWPTKILVDHNGYIRYQVRGEGAYQRTEQAIQAVLRLRDPDVALPQLLEPVRPEDASGAVCYRSTPELYAGYARGALGNPEGYAASGPLVYRLPLEFQRVNGSFYAEGIWQAGPEAFAFAGREAGRIVVPYQAAGVNAVLSPSADPVEVMLNLRPTDAPPLIDVLLDGAFLTPENAGADIEYNDGGVSYIKVDRPRMFELVKQAVHGMHELELIFRAGGLALYAFTFNTCVAHDADADDPHVFEMK